MRRPRLGTTGACCVSLNGKTNFSIHASCVMCGDDHHGKQRIQKRQGDNRQSLHDPVALWHKMIISPQVPIGPRMVFYHSKGCDRKGRCLGTNKRCQLTSPLLARSRSNCVSALWNALTSPVSITSCGNKLYALIIPRSDPRITSRSRPDSHSMN